jgi:hypothetical protein
MVKKQSMSCASRVFPGACLFMRFARCGKRQAARQVRRAPRGLARLGACAIDTVSWGCSLRYGYPALAVRLSLRHCRHFRTSGYCSARCTAHFGSARCGIHPVMTGSMPHSPGCRPYQSVTGVAPGDCRGGCGINSEHGSTIGGASGRQGGSGGPGCIGIRRQWSRRNRLRIGATQDVTDSSRAGHQNWYGTGAPRDWKVCGTGGPRG